MEGPHPLAKRLGARLQSEKGWFDSSKGVLGVSSCGNRLVLHTMSSGFDSLDLH